MKTSTSKVMLIAGGAALVFVALIARGFVPELVRYLRIRRL